MDIPPDTRAANGFDALAAMLAGIEHGGGSDLLRGRAQLLAGQHEGAVEVLIAASRAGLPAEAQPHALLLRGIALLRGGRAQSAVDLLARAWHDYPDFLALAVGLGIALCGIDRYTAAAGPLYAAVTGEDPDGTIATYRTMLDGFHRLVGHA